MNTNELLKYKRKELDLTMKQVAEFVGVSEATVSRWESGNIANMGRDKIALLAQILKLSPGTIAGYETQDEFAYTHISNILPIPKMKKVPRLGTIACGEPILAVENIETNDFVPADIKCDFTLKCKGDSMINARINDGDIVYIKSQSMVESGEIAACLVEGDFETEATLKRYYKYDNHIVLQAENLKYQPFVYVNEDMNKVRIIGKAVGFTSKL